MGKVQFLLGRTGSGKSAWIAEQIRCETERSALGSKLFWVVPTALSYTTERKLLQAVPTALRAEVVHLQRLAARLNADLHCGPQNPGNTTGRRLLLAEVFHREAAKLQVLHKEAPTVPFLDAVLDVFDEMSAQCVAFERVQAALETAATSLSAWEDEYAAMTGQSLLGKLRDLCTLYVGWKQALETHKLYNPADLLEMVRPHVHRWPELAGARLFVDGFSEMTESELAFVLDLAASAEETVISLCVDPDWFVSGKAESPTVFAPQSVTLYGRLREACTYRGLDTEELHFSVADRTVPAGIVGIEQRLFAAGTPAPGQGVGVHLAAAQNIRTETDGVARELRALQQRSGLSFADALVLVPDVERYAPYLRDAFGRYEIPSYMDDFSPLAAHPLAKFLLAVLQCLDEDFSLLSVLRLLKTEFVGVSLDDADWLETYARTYEVSGPAAWLDEADWRYSAAQGEETEQGRAADARADALRRQVVRVIGPLREQLRAAALTAQDLARALWDLLQRVDAKKRVADWMVNEGADLSPVEASLHEQAWQRVMGLLNDLTESVPDTPLQRSFLLNLVKNDLSTQSLSTIPAGLGEVLVTDYRRARGFQGRVVFVMGVTDGALPHRWRTHGLLSDDERIQFQRLFGQALAPTAEERQAAEKFSVYTVLTRATERLYLTYPLSDIDGKEIRPSAVITQVRALFDGGVSEELLWTTGGDRTDSDFCWLTPRAALEQLIAALRTGQAEPMLPAAVQVAWYRWWTGEEVRREAFQSALSGLFHRTAAASLPASVAAALYGQPLRLTAYQLESFAACPYQHFAKYGLKLQEETTPDITAAARGTVIHDTLNRFIEQQLEDVEQWRALTDEQAVLQMRRAFEEILAEPKTANWWRRAIRRYQADGVWQVLERAAVVLTRHARFGTFTPFAMELSFGGDREGDLPALEMDLGGGQKAVLRGRIDRVDLAKDASGSTMFRIVDYKSSPLDLDLSEVEYGLRLQLPMYALVVQQYSEQLWGQPALPVGLVYIPVLRKTSLHAAPSDGPTAVEESIKQMRARGKLLADRDAIAAMDERLATGQDSELFRKVFKNDGSYMKSAPVLEAHDWQAMLDRVRTRVHDTAKAIASGDVSIAPYQLAPTQQACTYCEFRSVCHIDKRWDSRPVRKLTHLSEEQVLTKWRGDEEAVGDVE